METFENITDMFNRLAKTVDDVDLAIEENLGEEAAMNASAERQKLAKQLQVKYPETYDTYVSYHALIGSTPTYEPMPGRAAVTKGDFPGEDSVDMFLRNLRRRYNV